MIEGPFPGEAPGRLTALTTQGALLLAIARQLKTIQKKHFGSHLRHATLFIAAFFSILLAAAPRVVVTKDQLVIDGTTAPFLFGAEVQYFRARGGPQRNVPREVVNRLWDKLIDRVVEAKMNTVIFYIPWDFHEPKEGVFDFDGTLDQDGDGHADYPSRNVKGFLKKLIAKGITKIMVRPGPYINAEWGPTGFGAVPLWFLEKYPDSIAVAQSKDKPRVVTFGHPVFRERAAHWISTLQREVLKPLIGKGSPIIMLQIDNETNYFWDSVYERDHSRVAVNRYRTFLKNHYANDLKKMNRAYGGGVLAFESMLPPTKPSDHRFQAAWHYDWYLFHDVEILDYYRFIRKTWETVGVTGDDLLFTSCDSFNTMDYGLLPRLDWRQRDQLTFTTMNVYPKTMGSAATSTMNTPMKAAHDAILINAAHEQFYGSGGNWLMSTETVGGWFPPVEVTLNARQHTYGSLLGSGAKAISIYYFHEGWNWDGLEKKDSELLFDAPLDKDMNARPSYQLVKSFGSALDSGLGKLIGTSEMLFAPVLIAHSSDHQYSLPDLADALKINADYSAGLFGLFREAGALPKVAFIDEMSAEDLRANSLVIWQSVGYLHEKTKAKLLKYLQDGGALLVIGDNPFAGAAGRVLHWPKSLADGWNDDRYLRLSEARDRLEQVRLLLLSLGLELPVKIGASDGQPFVHAWLRWVPVGGNLILFVEDFGRTPRSFTLSLNENVLPAATNFNFKNWLTPSRSAPLTRDQLTTVGVAIELPPDSVGIWELSPK